MCMFFWIILLGKRGRTEPIVHCQCSFCNNKASAVACCAARAHGLRCEVVMPGREQPGLH